MVIVQDNAHLPQGRFFLISALTGEARSEFITAHILPLASRTFGHNLNETAVAAIFLSPDADQFAKLPGADILGVIYGLTMAEKRVVDALADGKTSVQAAEALCISEATMRSHLTRIFAKTGVTRQAELISLMYRLVLPITVPSSPNRNEITNLASG